MLGPQYRPTAVGRPSPIANSVVKGEAGVAMGKGQTAEPVRVPAQAQV